MASRRIRILRALRDALAPLYPVGGCALWNQAGTPAADVPQATIRIETDRVLQELNETRVQDGNRSGGTHRRELAISIEVLVTHDVDVFSESTDELVDQELVKAERATMAIDWLEALGEPIADVRVLDTVPFPTTPDGAIFAGGIVHLSVRYDHYALDPEIA